MSVLGTLILLVITAGLTYFGTSQLGGGSGGFGPAQLSPDVQKYIDARLAGGQSADQELQRLTTRLTEMETKLVEMEKVKASNEQLAGKSEIIESAINEQRRRRDDALAAARTTEMAQLRNEIAQVCAGVSIKRVQSGAMPIGGRGGDAETYRRNLGIETQKGRRQQMGGGGGGGQGQGGGGNRRGMRRGGGGGGGNSGSGAGGGGGGQGTGGQGAGGQGSTGGQGGQNP